MRIVPGATEDQRQGMALAQKAGEQIRAIRADNNLSPKGKAAQMAEVWLSAQEQLQALAQRESKARDARRQELEREIFGMKGTADPATAISYRDAQDRVSNVTTRDEALQLLARADRSGDEVLARAVGQRAVEQQWQDVLEAFAESRPKVVEALEALSQLNPDPLAWRLGAELSYSVPIPPELQGMSENTMRIEAAAARAAQEQRAALSRDAAPFLAG